MPMPGSDDEAMQMPDEQANGWVLHRAPASLAFQRKSGIPGRILLAGLGCAPLLAPYELLIRPGFDRYVSLPFLFALVIGGGVTLVSALFFAAAVAGLDESIVINPEHRRIAHHTRSWVRRGRERIESFDAILDLTTETHSWTDGPDDHAIVLRFAAGPPMRVYGIEDPTTVERWTDEVEQAIRR
jgi:hypothetical protein